MSACCLSYVYRFESWRISGVWCESFFVEDQNISRTFVQYKVNVLFTVVTVQNIEVVGVFSDNKYRHWRSSLYGKLCSVGNCINKWKTELYYCFTNCDSSPYGSKRLNKSSVRSCCQNLLFLLKTALQWRPAGKTVCRLLGIQFHILTCTKLVPLFTSGGFVLAKAARHALSRKRLCICVSRECNELVLYQTKGEVNAVALFPVHAF